MTQLPRKTAAKIPTSQASANEEHAPVATVIGAITETFVRTCEKWTNGAATVNAEVMSFINNRLSHDVEFGEAVVKSESWAGMINVQQEWARQATQEYFAEATRLAELAAKLTQEIWEPVFEQANQVLGEPTRPVS